MNNATQGERSRLGEDDLVSRALIKLLADCIGVSTSEFRLPLLTGSASENVDVYQESEEPLLDPIGDLVAGKVSRQLWYTCNMAPCTITLCAPASCKWGMLHLPSDH